MKVNELKYEVWLYFTTFFCFSQMQRYVKNSKPNNWIHLKWSKRLMKRSKYQQLSKTDLFQYTKCWIFVVCSLFQHPKAYQTVAFVQQTRFISFLHFSSDYDFSSIFALPYLVQNLNFNKIQFFTRKMKLFIKVYMRVIWLK